MNDGKLICEKCERGPFGSPAALKQHKTLMHTRRAKPAKRKKYHRRKRQQIETPPTVNYCPVCRCDLRSIALALQFTK